MNVYIVTHRVNGKTWSEKVGCKISATDRAYSLVLNQGGTASVQRSAGTLTWGIVRGVRKIVFFWNRRHLISRSILAT